MPEGRKIKRVCYDLIRENCDKYGGLYAWDDLRVNEEADSLQGICPDGWHIPDDTEWVMLRNYNYQGRIAYFWTSSSYSTTAAWMRMIGRKNVNVNRSTVPKTYCFSVRCIKD